MSDCNPIDFVDINWSAFNKKLDDMPSTSHFHLDYANSNEVLADISKYYTPENSTYYDYISPDFIDLFTCDFFVRHKIDKENAFIKVLEHHPGNFTIPHKDYYTSFKKNKSSNNNVKIKRLWIPCTDHKFGHALFFDNKVIYNYRAGDVFEIEGNNIHSATNAGVEIRRIMTITSRIIA